MTYVGLPGLWLGVDLKPVVDTTGIGYAGPSGLESQKGGVNDMHLSWAIAKASTPANTKKCSKAKTLQSVAFPLRSTQSTLPFATTSEAISHRRRPSPVSNR